MTENNICPGCGRHCDLTDPHCSRGEEYSRTGVMPEQRNEKGHYEGHSHREGHSHHKGHGHHDGSCGHGENGLGETSNLGKG